MERLPIDAAVERIRDEGLVPLMIVAYDPKESKFIGYTFNDQNPQEVTALLKTINMEMDCTNLP